MLCPRNCIYGFVVCTSMGVLYAIMYLFDYFFFFLLRFMFRGLVIWFLFISFHGFMFRGY